MDLKEILLEYQNRREKNELILEKKKEIFLNEHKNIKNLDDQIYKLSNDIVKIIFQNTDEIEKEEKINNIKKEISILEKEKDNQIKKLNISDDFFIVKYNCEICKDTGFITQNGKTKKCHCLEQKILNQRYNDSNLSKLEENFDTFNLEYYSDNKVNNEKSSRLNMIEILNIAKEFVADFNKSNAKYKNLIFLGKTGLGKTFLSNAIAKEILKKGYTVFYQTSPNLFNQLMQDKINNISAYNALIYNLLNVDLLIIDDFGVENITDSKMVEIFNIINGRIIKNKSTLISTNLLMENLIKYYDDRIVSRILGNYTKKIFYGEDIRIKKARLQKNNGQANK